MITSQAWVKEIEALLSDSEVLTLPGGFEHATPKSLAWPRATRLSGQLPDPKYEQGAHMLAPSCRISSELCWTRPFPHDFLLKCILLQDGVIECGHRWRDPHVGFKRRRCTQTVISLGPPWSVETRLKKERKKQGIITQTGITTPHIDSGEHGPVFKHELSVLRY